MNSEEELKKIVGEKCVGVGAVSSRNTIMLFFYGRTLAIKFEHGVMTWEVIEETLH